ncbi:LON peptidase N-terminal domain and RING finger protein 3-like [Argiope bruennichi]|uniref:LON peptidase N-terminal domain and RING like protein n=1 Tax=Argiope bruennichi TaxID=94029 RepID=A0A8T0F1J9_ARGBR|nr:LON peptidase N-terminal domain and RING finger protein 3-like [Argiope bruennichi]KAF8784977.1 LON peptidase N-terminal domain and RING like protein [Argiope bruennichi]
MGESDLQAIYNKNSSKRNENLNREIQDSTAVDFLKSLVESYLKRGKVHDALNAYISAYSSDFLDQTCLETFVAGLIEKARKMVTKDMKFNVSFFLCSLCCDVMTDPVTLKCGHTYSKKCILSVSQTESFVCRKCNKSYSHAYLSQLKINVKISALIEKFLKTQQADHKRSRAATPDCVCGTDSSSNQNASFSEADDDLVALEAFSSKSYLRKGDLLVKLEKYEEAIKHYLISLTFDPNLTEAKEKALKFFHNFLHKCPTKMYTKNFCPGEFISSNVARMDNESTVSYSPVMKEKKYDGNETKNLNLLHSNKQLKIDSLHDMLDDFYNEVEYISEDDFVKDQIDLACLDKQDFECALCIRILWEPVSTTCGHTFCRVCLNRSLDHQTNCPLCKASLSSFLAERVQSTTEFLEKAIETLFPNEYADRKASYEEEMEELYNAGKDPEHVIPLFVCTIAFPTVPCPLHVFEPRYRLMIRQCMESGSRQFGMCAFIDNDIAEYGTMLEIRDVQYFPDGRSVVDTIGSRRFRILRKGERDGYSTGAVEFLKDESLNANNLQDVIEMHDQVYKVSQAWFMRLPRDTKQEILQHFGPMPEIEAGYINSANGPSWFWWMLAVLPLEPKSRLMILSMTSLPRRLKTLYRVLLHLQSTIVV